MAQGKKVEKEKLFHDTEKLLKKYRDIRYELNCKKMYAEEEIEQEFGQDIENFLDSVYQAGATLENTKLESMVQSMKRSNDMLKMLENAVRFLREHHKYGETYYWILYYTYLSRYEADGFDNLMEQIQKYVPNISPYIYYDRRKDAIQRISDYLWGYTSKDSIKILKDILQEIPTI